MRKIVLGLSLWLLGGVSALAQPLSIPCTATSTAGPPCVPVTSSAPLPITGTISVTEASVGATGAAVPASANYIGINVGSNLTGAAGGHGTAAGALRVELPTDGTGIIAGITNTVSVAGVGTAGTANAGVVTVQGIASMTPVLVTPSNPIGTTPTDRTVTSATGSSQTVMSSNSSRRSMTLVNTGSSNCGVNPTGGTAVIGGAGTITLAPLGAYTPRIPTLAAVTAICTSGQPLYADES